MQYDAFHKIFIRWKHSFQVDSNQVKAVLLLSGLVKAFWFFDNIGLSFFYEMYGWSQAWNFIHQASDIFHKMA